MSYVKANKQINQSAMIGGGGQQGFREPVNNEGMNNQRQFSLPQINNKQAVGQGGGQAGGMYNGKRDKYGQFGDLSQVDNNPNRNIFYSNNNSVAVPNKNYIPGTNVFKNEKNYVGGGGGVLPQQKAAQMYNQKDVYRVFDEVDDRQKVKVNLLKQPQQLQPIQQQQQQQQYYSMQPDGQQMIYIDNQQPQGMVKSNTEKHVKQKRPGQPAYLEDRGRSGSGQYGFPPGAFYNPEEGFVVRFDYISHMPDNFCQLSIKYGVFFDMKENLLEAELETHYIEEHSEYQRLVQKAFINGVEAHPRMVLFIELIGLSRDDYRISKVWTIHYLFDESGDLIAGKFKIPFYSLDYNGHMLLREALPAVGPAHLHLRIHTARDLALNTDKISPPSQYLIQGLHTRDKNHQYEKLEIRKQESELQDYVNNKLSDSENLEILWRVDLNYLHAKKKEIKWKQQSTAFMEGNPNIKHKDPQQQLLMNAAPPKRSGSGNRPATNKQGDEAEQDISTEKTKKAPPHVVIGNQDAFERLTQPIKQLKKPRDTSVKRGGLNNNSVNLSNVAVNPNPNEEGQNAPEVGDNKQNQEGEPQGKGAGTEVPGAASKTTKPSVQPVLPPQQQPYIPITLKLFEDETEQQKKKQNQKKISVLDQKRMEEEEKEKKKKLLQQQQQQQQLDPPKSDQLDQSKQQAPAINDPNGNKTGVLPNTTGGTGKPNPPTNAANTGNTVNNNSTSNATTNNTTTNNATTNANGQASTSPTDTQQQQQGQNQQPQPPIDASKYFMQETEEQHFERLKKQVADKMAKKKEEQKQKQQKQEEQQPKKEPIDQNRALTLCVTIIEDYIEQLDLLMEVFLMYRTSKLKDNSGNIVWEQKLLETVPALRAIEVKFQLQQKVNPLRLREEYGDSEILNIYFVFNFKALVAETKKTGIKTREIPYAWFALPLFTKVDVTPNRLPGQPLIVQKEFNAGRFSQQLWQHPIKPIPFKVSQVDWIRPVINIEMWDDKPLPPIEQPQQQQQQRPNQNQAGQQGQTAQQQQKTQQQQQQQQQPQQQQQGLNNNQTATTKKI